MVRRVRLVIASLACCLVVASAQAQQQPAQPKQQQLQSIETAPAPPAQVEPPAAAEPPPSYRPGFIDALGRFLGGSKEAIDSQVRGTQETLGTIGSQARDAAGNVIAIPSARVITGRQLCPAASNGAPDCQQGADALCRAKGFQGGRNLDVTSAQRCPARVYLEARPPKEGECRTETYVTRAVCQ
ncbi:MAG: hypothetical protein K2Y71_08145 [Xanthobacteraceae bacterium]|nr:hypothetical protein [Xanthobacteraceae bacterium]